ncbi:cytochrome P450 [Mycolicibacterium wolinskyi]|uniref:Steroid C26-monooxygenase n=1 Tax=Mycolicibacterium wolinskyi TaxID=59750 RepID=A0A132PCJ7_9MYCO|nr:cytochrome P450 [Mycolicibacterium wolinskyi]KWX20050.1 cytochrome P450 [Mycolicibacterium wolinskyi]
MTVGAVSDVCYDPYDIELNVSPYETYARLREEAPLYYNSEYDFYALSRFEDVDSASVDTETFSSARGDVLETVKANIDIPPGFIIFEDPPIHDIHRKLLARMFTPRKISALEPKIREFCADCLDPFVGSERFDFVADLGARMPMRVIGMLLGMPDEHLEAVRKRWDDNLRTEAGKPMEVAPEAIDAGELFAEYVEWRVEHPSNDIISELANVEFADETGTTRRLRRDELRAYASLVVGAGNETTNRLIGWTGKVLAEYPDQRRQLAEDHSLIAKAIEELVRFEPSGPNMARYVTRDVDYYGQTVPAGSVMLLMLAAANRDHRHFPPDGDVFDIHRRSPQHLGFGRGVHYCLGSALARLEGRIALEEILKRFPEWDVDLAQAKLTSTSAVRGWESMPVVLR